MTLVKVTEAHSDVQLKRCSRNVSRSKTLEKLVIVCVRVDVVVAHFGALSLMIVASVVIITESSNWPARSLNSNESYVCVCVCVDECKFSFVTKEYLT